MNQLDLLSFREAESRAQLGMQRAVDRADKESAGWSERAFNALLAYIANNESFTAEEARAAIHNSGLALPPDGRAWGAVFKKAASLGWIERDGFAPRRCGNMTPTIVWRRT